MEKCIYCGNEIGDGYFCVAVKNGFAHNSCHTDNFPHGEQPDIKDCEDSRVWNVLNMMVEGYSITRYGFSSHVSSALRDYADAIDAGVGAMSNPEVFIAGNKCRIKIIAGELRDSYQN